MQLLEQLGDWRRFDRVQSRALAGAIEAAIVAGDLLAGDRLPPEREFAAHLGVSRTLVVAAYALLREAGWALSRQGSGTRIVKGAPGHVAASRRHSVNASPLGRPAQRENMIDLSIATAVPDPSWLQPSAAARSLMLREYAYQPQGMLPLRERIAARFTRAGVPTTPAQILITNGAQQALALVAQRYARCRTVLVEEPTYFGALDCLRAAGARLRPVPIERDGGGPREMARQLAAGAGDLAYVCPTAHNPTGLTWTASERTAAVRAAAKSGALLVVDDSLSELSFAAAPPTLAHGVADAAIVTVGSLSKTLWGGLRVGWLRADETIVAALASDRLWLDLGGGVVGGALACDLLDRYDVLLRQRRLALRRQRDACAGMLRARLPQWRFALPEGGMFLWLQLPRQDADAFAEHAFHHGVLLTPGKTLYAGAAPGDRLRLSYAPAGALWQEAGERLAAAWAAFA